MKKNKQGGAGLSRTEIVTVRLNPQLKYMAELAARKQRRTLSGYIEYMLSIMINDPVHGIGLDLQVTWDVDPMERLVALEASYPYMLTYDEQLLLKNMEKK